MVFFFAMKSVRLLCFGATVSSGGPLAKKIFIICTESSGDLLGGSLVAELQATRPELEVLGVGGNRLVARGMRPTFHIRDFNVMGLFEVLAQLKRLKSMFHVLVRQAKTEKPDLILLIDAPDFNLRFARAMGGLSIPIIYYVSPQVWAWRRKRAKDIAGLVDHMLVLFRFEKPIFEELGLATTWVGHPLVDELKHYGAREDFFREHGFDSSKPLVALAPGSRSLLVRKLLPVMRDVARARAGRYQFVVALAPTIDARDLNELLAGEQIPILEGHMREVMFHADAALVASGTATLETALLHTPMIVGYRLKSLSYLLARRLVKVPYFALVNIVLKERVVPELIQEEFCGERVLPLLDEMIATGPVREGILKAFDRLEDELGGGGASRKAAAVVEGYLDR